LTLTAAHAKVNETATLTRAGNRREEPMNGTVSEGQFLPLSRRQALALLTAAPAVVAVATHAAQAAPPREVPSLAPLVAKGNLPPVAQRLPGNPLVVQATDKPGAYGGTWRSALMGSSDANWLIWTIGYASLVRWTPDWKGVTPDVAESYTVDPDSRVFTFKLRRGMRWSDGHPFTSNDIMFWYQDVLLHKQLTPSPPAFLTSSGKTVVVVEAPDPETVVFRFADSNGMFLQRLAISNTASAVAFDILANSPRHYLEKFHIKYNPDADRLAKQAGFNNWVELYNSKANHPDRWRGTELPVLTPWMLATPYSGNATEVVARRNPYFYKVDTDGNQLPYIDEVTYVIVQDPQALLLKVINGEIDLHYNNINTIDMRPTLYDNRDKGNYVFFATVPAWSNTMLINLNQTHPDSVKRQIYGNKDFRIGLSYAMNRKEIIEVIYVGQGEPWQGAPRPNTDLYNERFAKQYTEYDPKQANAYLDKVGMTKRGPDGMRLGPDGKPFVITLEIGDFFTTHIDSMDLLKKYWHAVGITLEYRVVDRSLLYTRMQANQLDGTTWIGGGGYDQLTLLDPKWYFPQHVESAFAPAWAQWYLNPHAKNAEEPPDEIKQQITLYDQVQRTADPAKQREYMAKILDLAADQFRVIGTSLEPDRYGIRGEKMDNTPKSIPLTVFYSGIGPANPEQFCFTAKPV
jgi:peptide/nickel transport system substrate-binding protein